MIGDKFGKWEVISEQFKKNGRYYLTCRCSCDKHTIRDVQKTYLITGKSKSCGCTNHYRVNDNMVGKRFGKLVVIKQVKSSDSNSMWLCQCDCGNEVKAKGFKLRTGHIKSCGNCDHTGEIINGIKLLEKLHGAWYKCLCPHCNSIFYQLYSKLTSGHIKSCGCKANKPIDMIGKNFGNWTVIAPADNYRFWWCECSCEKHTKKLVNGGSLRSGLSTSCGCKSINFCGSSVENEIKDYIFTLTNEIPIKKKILAGAEIDMLYTDSSIGVEYNGSAYHASINGFRNNKPTDYHLQKFICAKNMGIHLVNIFDVDWIDNREKIEGFLYDLFVDPNIILIDDCIVRIISPIEALGFCSKYSFQMNIDYFSVCYGIYYRDTLYAVMSFYKISDIEYLLADFCTMFGYYVVGGYNQLLNMFELNHDIVHLVGYSNNDYYSGKEYSDMGFSCVGQEEPTYFWCKHNEKYHYDQNQINDIIVSHPELYQEAINNNIEDVGEYIMSKFKAYKVYRSGRTKWEKHYENNIS